MEADCLSLESSSLVASWEGGGYLVAIDTILTLCALVIRPAWSIHRLDLIESLARLEKDYYTSQLVKERGTGIRSLNLPDLYQLRFMFPMELEVPDFASGPPIGFLSS
jgi:hypothetical protein